MITARSFSPQALASIAWVLMWALSFSITMSLTKLLSHDISTIMVVFIRQLFGLVFVLPFIFKNGAIKNLATKRLPLHSLRVGFICVAWLSTYYAYAHLPLAFATSIGFTAPLITTTLAVLVLQESVSWRHWIFIVVGYIGVLVMVQPGVIAFDFAVGVALLANLSASIGLIATKRLSATESPLQLLTYNNVGGILVFGILALFYWQAPSPYNAMLLSLIAATGTFSGYCYVKALQKGEASLVAPFEYSRLIFAIPVGLFFFSEIPTLWTLVGGVVIIASNFGLTWLKSNGAAITVPPTTRTNPAG